MAFWYIPNFAGILEKRRPWRGGVIPRNEESLDRNLGENFSTNSHFYDRRECVTKLSRRQMT